MKKQNIIALILGMSFTLVALSEEVAISIPKFNQLKRIYMGSANSSWMGIFRSNGSAHLGYGALDGADVPKASFQFEEIYNLLVPHLKQDSNDEENMAVGLLSDSPTAKTFYLEDKETMRKIMHGLCDKVLESPDPFLDVVRFKGLLRKSPIVPGDPPYLKEEDQIKSEVRGQKSEGEEEVIGDEPKEEIKEEVIGDQLEVKEEVAGDQLEVTGAGTGEEMPSPVAARKTNRPSLLFYVGAGILVCVGAALFFTRKR